MAVSRSGRFMATGQCGMNADVRVWDLATGTCVHVLSEHDEGVACVAFSLDERLLASCGVAADGKLFVWDVETGAIVANGPCEPRDARAVAFSPVVVQGVYTLACAGADVVIYGIDAGEGKIGGQKCGVGHTKRAYCSVIFDDDGERAHCGSTSGDVASFGVAGCVIARARPVLQRRRAGVGEGPHGGWPVPGGRRRRHGFRVQPGSGRPRCWTPDHVWKLKRGDVAELRGRRRFARADADGLEVVDKVVACTSEGMKYLCPTRKSAREVRERGSGSDENQEGPELLEESHVAPVKLVTFAPQGAVFGAANAHAPADADAPDIGSCVSASWTARCAGGRWTRARARDARLAAHGRGAPVRGGDARRDHDRLGRRERAVPLQRHRRGPLDAPDAHAAALTAVGGRRAALLRHRRR